MHNRRTDSFAVRAVFSAMLVLLLVAVRLFERQWFPEPLLDFFGSQRYLTGDLPALHPADYCTMLLRYITNAVFSLALLFLWVKNRRLRRFLVLFYAIAGPVLLILLIISATFYRPGEYHLLFYIRRMLIQPLFLFILIPLLWPAIRNME